MTGDPFIDAWVKRGASALGGTEASIGLTLRIPSGYLHPGSRFHPREYSRQREVYVAEFELAHTPVTVSQYAAFLLSESMRQQRWWTPEGWEWANERAGGWGRRLRWFPDAWETQTSRPMHPVTGVTLYEAQAYCAWVSEEKKKEVRLPGDVEWERAARGDDGRPFPWGDGWDPALANTIESERGDTAPVGSVEGDLSPFRVRDMAGNVQEWTASPYTPLPDEVFPPGPLQVVCGGSYNDTAFGARVSYRRAYPPGYFYPFLGFRVVVGLR